MEKTSCIPGEPFIKLGEGEAPTLNYNLAQETCFSIYGRRRIALNPKYYLKSASAEPANHYWKELKKLDSRNLREQIIKKLEGGLPLSGLVRNTDLVRSLTFATTSSSAKQATTKSVKTTAANENIRVETTATKSSIAQDSGNDVDLLVAAVNDKLLPYIHRTFSGKPRVDLVNQPNKPTPCLFVVEEYRVCSYLGDYGAGKTVKTFTLLPGEKTSISVSSYTDRVETREASENILDSFSSSSANSFEESLNTEAGITEKTTESSSEAHDDGFGGGLSLEIPIKFIDLGVNIEGSTSTTKEDSSSETREHYVKVVTNTIAKHTAESNRKRTSLRNTRVMYSCKS